MNNNVFEYIKEAVPIIDAARYYGLSVDDKGKALCCFHSEKTPSLSFKGKTFKCFGCGEGGDVIKLVQHLTGAQRPIEAAKRINVDYRLDIDFESRQPQDRPIMVHGITQREYEAIKQVARRAKRGEI